MNGSDIIAILNYLGITKSDIIHFLFSPIGIIISVSSIVVIVCLFFCFCIPKQKFEIIYPIYEINIYPKTTNRAVLIIDKELPSGFIGLAGTIYHTNGTINTPCFIVEIEKITTEGKTQLKSMVLTQDTINNKLKPYFGKRNLKDVKLKLGVDFNHIERFYNNSKTPSPSA